MDSKLWPPTHLPATHLPATHLPATLTELPSLSPEDARYQTKFIKLMFTVKMHMINLCVEIFF